MLELLCSGLQNDPSPETFPVLRGLPDQKQTPIVVRYVKLVPLVAWGHSQGDFNFSIWHVKLHGCTDADMIAAAEEKFAQLQEQEVIRMCLKHFRQRRYMDTFDSLQKRTRVQLEAPVFMKLYETLVEHGDFATAEQLVSEAMELPEFASHVAKWPCKARWTQIVMAEGAHAPGPRGGHQMCADPTNGAVYMYGGWDGTRDLADFWVYNQNGSGTWAVLSEDTARVGGPGARSCHRMCLDPSTRQLYVFGRFEDPSRAMDQPHADFYRYDIAHDEWELLDRDTSSVGGPELLFDHAMCIDPSTHMLYVFGGKRAVVNPPNDFSGMFRYDCSARRWSQLRFDIKSSPLPDGHILGGQLNPRMGHSMVLEPSTQSIFVFAGQRHAKDYLNDLFRYDIRSNTIEEISHNTRRRGGPGVAFTQQATIDLESREL